MNAKKAKCKKKLRLRFAVVHTERGGGGFFMTLVCLLIEQPFFDIFRQTILHNYPSSHNEIYSLHFKLFVFPIIYTSQFIYKRNNKGIYNREIYNRHTKYTINGEESYDFDNLLFVRFQTSLWLDNNKYVIEGDDTNGNIGQDIVKQMRKRVNKFKTQKENTTYWYRRSLQWTTREALSPVLSTLHWSRLLVTNNKAIRFEPGTRKMNHIGCIRGRPSNSGYKGWSRKIDM